MFAANISPGIPPNYYTRKTKGEKMLKMLFNILLFIFEEGIDL